ncbi:hypothetical protein GGF32_002045 [Allomyces javanicus]|nr:hypothetical protein GGF32_002045 [Allomyces javanicus]
MAAAAAEAAWFSNPTLPTIRSVHRPRRVGNSTRPCRPPIPRAPEAGCLSRRLRPRQPSESAALRFRALPLFLAALFALLVGWTGFTVATYVAPTGGSNVSGCGATVGSPCATIQYAIDQTPSGGTVTLLPGSYTGPGNVQLQFPSRQLNITSTQGAAATIIDGGTTAQIFTLSNGESGWVDGVTIRRGFGICGGCVLQQGTSLNFTNVIFEACNSTAATGQSPPSSLTASSGGAVYLHGSSAAFYNVVFRQNYARNAGGSIFLDAASVPDVQGSTFTNEQADGFGGSIVSRAGSAGKFFNCAWSSCTSKFGGSIALGELSRTVFDVGSVTGSTSTQGGAVFHYADDYAVLSRMQFSDSVATGNGGVSMLSVSASPTYRDCVFLNNQCRGVGGAIYAEASVVATMIGGSLIGNSALGGGGGIYARGNAYFSITNTRFQGQRSLYGGGLLFEDATKVDINGAVCANNTADQDGAGIKIANDVVANLVNVTLVYNAANAGGGGGLQADQSSQVTVVNSTITDNYSSVMGGGIYVTKLTQAAVRGSYLARNNAPSGGGLAVDSLSALQVTQTIFEGNTATRGGALYVASGTGIRVSNSSVFLGNVASLGGAAYFQSGATATSLIADSSLVQNTARAGACFFYNTWSRLLHVRNLQYSNNTADYGLVDATPPYRLTVNGTVAAGYSPKDTFDLRLNVIDYFNNLATYTASPITVTMTGSAGLSIASTIFQQTFEKGQATFGDLSISGQLGHSYQLSVSTPSLPAVSFNVSILSCGPGYARKSEVGDPVYVCAMCEPGTYSLVADEACQNCPKGGDCSQGGAAMLASEGWWLDSDSVATGRPTLYPCQLGDCVGRSTCAEHQTGRLCSQCIPGYSLWNDECRNCSRSHPSWMLLPLGAGTIFAAIMICFRRTTEHGVFKSLAFFMQVAIVLLGSDHRMSAQNVLVKFNVAFKWVISLDYTDSCVLNLNSIQRLTYKYYAPSTPISGVVICYVLMNLYFLVVRRKWMPAYWHHRALAAFVWMFLWGYLLIVTTSLRLLNCVQVGSFSVLASAPDVICGSDQHRPYMIFAILVLIFYTLGAPLLTILWLRYVRAKHGKDEDSPLARELLRSFKPEYWWWEVFFMVRRVLLALVDVLATTKPDVRGVTLGMYLFGIEAMQFMVQPFKDRAQNITEDMVLTLLVLLSGFAYGNTMRANSSSDLNVTNVSIALVIIGVLLVLFFILLLTSLGHKLITKVIVLPPGLRQSVNSLLSGLRNIGSKMSLAAAGGSKVSLNLAGRVNGSRNSLTAATAAPRRSEKIGLPGLATLPASAPTSPCREGPRIDDAGGAGSPPTSSPSLPPLPTSGSGTRSTGSRRGTGSRPVVVSARAGASARGSAGSLTSRSPRERGVSEEVSLTRNAVEVPLPDSNGSIGRRADGNGSDEPRAGLDEDGGHGGED